MKRILLVALCLAGCAPAADPLVIATSGGLVRGTRDSTGMFAFRGIPYAAAPTGSRRWAPPADTTWTDTLVADRFRAACPQPPSIRRFNQYIATRISGDTAAVPALAETSEDCLHVNVWTRDLEGALPIIVWIHGGAGTAGSATEPVFDGALLAARGAVVITLNYRLGPLGFLAHPMLGEQSGNYGLLDISRALQWVRENAAHFGGDPERVTLAGQSAGASLIAHVMSMPHGRLFHGAILQSGTGLDMRRSLAEGEQLGAALVNALGNPSLDSLRALPPDVILRTAFMNGLVPDGPVVGGLGLPTPPADVFSEGWAAAVPVIVGSNAHELRSLPFLLPPPDLDAAAWRSGVRAEYGADAAAIEARYDSIAARAPAMAQEQLITDAWFLAPALLLAQLVTDAGQRAWVYSFAAAPDTALGAFHSAEIPYLFGRDVPGWWRSDDADRTLSSLVMDYWVAFAATGDPNGGNRPRWPVFEPQAPQLLRIDRAPSAQAVADSALDALMRRVRPDL